MEIFIEKFTNYFTNAFKSAFDADSSEGNIPGIKLIGAYTAMSWTGDASYDVHYIVVSEALQVFGPFVQNETLSPGLNPITIVDTVTGDPQPIVNLNMYLYDAFPITTAPDAFSYNLEEVIAAQLSGGGEIVNLPDVNVNSSYSKTYIGVMIPEEGDYITDYSFLDPNSDLFSSPDNGQLFRWAPHVFITEVDGNRNVEDPQPASTKSSIAVKYIKGANVATDGTGQPIYDIDGSIGFTGGQEITVNVDLTIGDNDITSQVTDIADDFSNLENAMNQIDIEREEVLALPLVSEKINEGITAWVDGEGVAQIGADSFILRGVTSYADRPTQDYFEAPYNDYKTQPSLGKVVDMVGNTAGVEINNSGAYLPPDEDNTIIITDFSRNGTGYTYGKAGLTVGSRFGLWWSSGVLNFWWYGNAYAGSYVKVEDQVVTYCGVNDTILQEYRIYANGVLVETIDTSLMTPVTNTLNILCNARYNTTDGTGALTYGSDSDLKHFRIADYAFTEGDANAEFRNDRKRTTAVALGSSSLAMSGQDNYWQYMRDEFDVNGLEVNTIRLALGGTAFYKSMYTSFDPHVAAGGLVPDAVSRPAIDPERNYDYARDFLKADMILVHYPSNYTAFSPAYVYGDSGYNDIGFEEKLYAYTKFDELATSDGILAFFSTDQPIDAATLIDGTATLRRDLHYITSTQLSASSLRVVDFFTPLAEDPGVDNTFAAGKSGDGIHPLPDTYEFDMFPPCYVLMNKYVYTRYSELTFIDPVEGDFVIAIPGDVIDVEYQLNEGIVNDINDTEAVIDGPNTIDRSGNNVYGFPYLGSIDITYGTPLEGTYSEYLMSSINASIIDDEIGNRDLTTFGNDTLAGIGWLFDGSTDYGRILNTNDWVPGNLPFTVTMKVKITALNNYAYMFGRTPNTTALQQAFYIKTDGALERVSGGNFLTLTGITMSLGTEYYITWRSDGVNDHLFIDKTKSLAGTMQSPVNNFDVNIGARMNSDDQSTGSPTRNFNGELGHTWYWKRALADAEIGYLVDNNL